MKKTLLSICALALAANIQVMGAGNANIYASGLKVGNGGSDIQFTLNAPGDVTINFYKDGVKVHFIEKTGLEKGVNTVSLAGIFPAKVKENDQLSWEVVAKAEANTEVVKFSDATQSAQQFYRASGLAINNNPASANFGTLYVSNSISGDATDRTTPDGIYVLDATLSDCTGQGATPYTGGQTWVDSSNKTSVASPHRLVLDEEENLFICDWSDGHSGVYVMDTNNPSADFKAVFGGTRNANGLVSEGDVNIHGSISALAVVGKGADRVLYTYDEDYVNTILRYNIGTMETPWVAAPSMEFTEPEGIILSNGGTGYLLPDGKGGLWVSQRRSGEVATYPCLIHLNSEFSMDYNFGTLIDGTGNYSMAINEAGNKMAICTDKMYFYDIAYDESNVPSLILDESATFSLGTARPYAVVFDVAENVYVVGSDITNILAFALPKADNTYTTPANEMIIVSNTMTGVESTIADDNAAVEYFNLQGVKVENPANGIFIRKQGSKAAKVIL